MNEIKEVLRRWLRGMPKKRIAAPLSLDPKSARRYVTVAETSGLGRRLGATLGRVPGGRTGARLPLDPTSVRHCGRVRLQAGA